MYSFLPERPSSFHTIETWSADQLSLRNVLSSRILVGRGESTPRHLRIYANHSNIIDFADAETTRPQLNISLLEGEVGVIEYPLRVAAFASINSLSLFFVRLLVRLLILPLIPRLLSRAIP